MAYISEKTGKELDELLDKIKQGGGGASITIDKELSDTSNNAIANSAVTNALKKKVDTTLFQENLNDLQLSIDTLYDETVRRWEFDEAIENKADTDGYYPSMTVGKAENLVGRGESTEEVFSFRPSAGSLSIEDGSAKITSIKGNSVVWNQLLLNSTFTSTTNWSAYNAVTTISSDGNKLVANISSEGKTIAVYQPYSGSRFVSNHRYLVIADFETSGGTSWGINIGITVFENLTNTTRAKRTLFVTAPTTPDTFAIYPILSNGTIGDFAYIYSVQFIDLTQMFGAEVANEITSYEDYLRLKPMNIANEYAYNEGTIVDMRVNEIKSVGDNAYNPELGYARVLGGKEYIFHDIFEIEFSTSPFSGGTHIDDFDGETYTFTQDGYVWCYGLEDNPCVCLKHTYDKPYTPYEADIKDLSFISELFPNGMRSAGNVCDEIRYNKATQKWQKIERIGVRAYEEGDAENSNVTTDGVNTNYALANPNPEDLNIDLTPYYEIWDFGTEEAIASGASTPFRADIVYQFNAVDRIRNNSTKIEELEAKIQSLTLAISALQTNE